MKNYRYAGDNLPFNPGSVVTSGSVVVLNAGPNGVIGVVVDDTSLTSGSSLVIDGVCRLPALTTDTGNQGDVVYWDVTNTRITTTRGTNTIAGRLAIAKSGTDTTADVVINEALVDGGLLYSQTAASVAITNTVVETNFDATSQYTLAANSLKVGDVIRLRHFGIATSTNSTDTLNVKQYLGAQVLGQTGALDVANNDVYDIEIEILIRTVGAGGTAIATGRTFVGTPGTANYKPIVPAQFAIDTTAAQLIKSTATWSVANAGNSVRNDATIVRRN